MVLSRNGTLTLSVKSSIHSFSSLASAYHKAWPNYKLGIFLISNLESGRKFLPYTGLVWTASICRYTWILCWTLRTLESAPRSFCPQKIPGQGCSLLLDFTYLTDSGHYVKTRLKLNRFLSNQLLAWRRHVPSCLFLLCIR